MLGAIEAGGTKFNICVTTDSGEIIDNLQVKTTNPKETMGKIIEFFQKYDIESIGIGCFGPVVVNPESDRYGEILDTPKLAWKGFNIVKHLKEVFDLKIVIDTDVNAAALAEVKFGNGKGLKNLVYITIGTGIGAGALVDGRLIHGMLHPEMGHINVKRHPSDDFKGICPYHADCLEGMASGPAIEKRFNKEASELPLDHIAWQIEAHYISEALVNYALILSPERIVLGGGVSKQKQLIPIVQKLFISKINGYINTSQINDIENYIVCSGLNDLAGLYGAIALVMGE